MKSEDSKKKHYVQDFNLKEIVKDKNFSKPGATFSIENQVPKNKLKELRQEDLQNQIEHLKQEVQEEKKHNLDLKVLDKLEAMRKETAHLKHKVITDKHAKLKEILEKTNIQGGS